MTGPARPDAKRDFLTMDDLSADEIRFLIDRAAVHKSERAAGRRSSFRPLDGRTVGLIFQKPSTRTRVSFQVGVFDLGGHIVYMQDESSRLGLREPIPHLARVLSGYLDLLVVRTFDHQEVGELARHAAIPVINALTDGFHTPASCCPICSRSRNAWAGSRACASPGWATATTWPIPGSRRRRRWISS